METIQHEVVLAINASLLLPFTSVSEKVSRFLTLSTKVEPPLVTRMIGNSLCYDLGV